MACAFSFASLVSLGLFAFSEFINHQMAKLHIVNEMKMQFCLLISTLFETKFANVFASLLDVAQVYI